MPPKKKPEEEKKKSRAKTPVTKKKTTAPAKKVTPKSRAAPKGGAKKRKIIASQNPKEEPEEKTRPKGWLYTQYLNRLRGDLPIDLVKDTLSFLYGFVTPKEAEKIENLSLSFNSNAVVEQIVELLIQAGYEITFFFLETLELAVEEKKVINSDEVILFQNPLLNDVNAEILEREQRQLFKAQIQEGVHTCGKCKAMKTRSYAIQLRRADEGMSYRIECAICENKWLIL